MRIKSELLWGESIRNKSKVYDLLQTGKLPFGYYLLLCTGKGDLELAPAKMQSNRYYISDEYIVFGVSYGKKEAYDMIADILSQIYVAHTYESVHAFAREVLGAELC